MNDWAPPTTTLEPPTVDEMPWWKRRSKGVLNGVWAGLAGTVVVLMGIGFATGALEAGPDASSELACRHFRNVAADASAGILNDAELRGKLAEVHDDGKYAEAAGIARASRDMLASITAGDMDDFNDAVNRMDRACDRAGL